jgi:hypothetical protein
MRDAEGLAGVSVEVVGVFVMASFVTEKVCPDY